ncbi:hypothetical protein LUZ60_006792 [Juncus effusus]|nr:hypothetical protein LUZ60_006792 [Juncus effusus]
MCYGDIWWTKFYVYHKKYNWNSKLLYSPPWPRVYHSPSFFFFFSGTKTLNSLSLSLEANNTMRLLTHNMLSCNIKGVTNGFPLKLEAEKWVAKEVDLNPDFLRGIFSKIEWPALVAAARSLGYEELPEQADASMLDSDEFLRRFHRALLELHVEEGSLVCPETGRKFPINKGIPNMLLHEDEV